MPKDQVHVVVATIVVKLILILIADIAMGASSTVPSSARGSLLGRLLQRPQSLMLHRTHPVRTVSQLMHSVRNGSPNLLGLDGNCNNKTETTMYEYLNLESTTCGYA